MVELRPDNYLEIRDKYEEGCDKDCDECPAFVEMYKQCVFDREKLWNKWTQKRHDEFQKFMEGK